VNRLGRQRSNVAECSLASQNQILKTAVNREAVDNLQKFAPECLYLWRVRGWGDRPSSASQEPHHFSGLGSREPLSGGQNFSLCNPREGNSSRVT
jgi:hypothetical protein